MHLRERAINCGADIYPSYTIVQDYKKSCLPKDIIYKDDEVVVTLQAAVNHTIEKICQIDQSLVDEMLRLKRLYGATIVFSYKFGGDGSGSHAQYRAVDADEIDQNTMFISMFCAIRIHAEWTDSDGNFQKSVLWENLMANSPYAHSPLRMKYTKESSKRNT